MHIGTSYNNANIVPYSGRCCWEISQHLCPRGILCSLAAVGVGYCIHSHSSQEDCLWSMGFTLMGSLIISSVLMTAWFMVRKGLSGTPPLLIGKSWTLPETTVLLSSLPFPEILPSQFFPDGHFLNDPHAIISTSASVFKEPDPRHMYIYRYACM